MSAAMMVDDSIPALLVILDGLGDLPCAVLGGETPAEYADTPVLDELTSRGVTGTHVPFGPGRATSSERSHWAMFGLSDVPFPGRAILELAGVGQPVPWGTPMWHFALRSGQASQLGLRVTGRAGSAEADEAASLGALLTAGVLQRTFDGIRFELLPVRAGEWSLVAHGAHSIEVSDSDPLFEHVHPWMRPVPTAAALAAGGVRQREAERSARALENLLIAVHTELLGDGTQWCVPTTKWASSLDAPLSFGDLVGVPGAMTGSSALYRGLSRVLTMDLIPEAGVGEPTVPDGEDLCAGLDQRLIAAGEYLGGSHGFVHVHTKATDEAGHRKDPLHKVAVIEACDAALSPLLELSESVSIIVTGDHATPSVTSMLHSGDPTPLLMCGPDVRPDAVGTFGESSCGQGALGQLRASDIAPVIFANARRPFFIGHQPGAHVTAAMPQAVSSMMIPFQPPPHEKPPPRRNNT